MTPAQAPRAVPPSARATPLRPATYAGVAAAVVSIVAALVIRLAPSAASVVTGLHLAVNITLFVMGGALAARLGGAGWRAGLFAGLVDALVGHPIAFLLATPPDPATVTLPPGMEATPQLLASLHLWGAVLGAITAVCFAVAAGAVGGWYARRSGVAPAVTTTSTGTGR
jgi:hypothetical protein